MSDLGRLHQYHGLQPVLSVVSVEAAVAFYRDALDFEVDFVEGDPGRYARVFKGDRSYGDPVYIHLALRDGTQGCASRLRIHVGHDVDGLCTKVQARGVAILAGPTSQPWGLREFSIRDPDGNELTFCGYLDPSPPGD